MWPATLSSFVDSSYTHLLIVYGEPKALELATPASLPAVSPQVTAPITWDEWGKHPGNTLDSSLAYMVHHWVPSALLLFATLIRTKFNRVTSPFTSAGEKRANKAQKWPLRAHLVIACCCPLQSTWKGISGKKALVKGQQGRSGTTLYGGSQRSVATEHLNCGWSEWESAVRNLFKKWKAPC
jgi:hypothetical protein